MALSHVQMIMTLRTMEDEGTLAKLFAVENLHPDLGSATNKELVSKSLLYGFLPSAC